MRIAREDCANLDPGDVAWVTEWQLSQAFPWVPIGEESPVWADARPEPDARTWCVSIRAGGEVARVRLPLRDLGRVVRWCHTVSRTGLLRPPPQIRGSLQALREALRRGLSAFDPLDRMGYSLGRASEREPGC